VQALRIPESFIQELRAKVDIVELVGSRVPLKKTGANYSGLCPFHQEKTPSFSVSPTRQLYHCFGCGVGGDGIEFLEAFDNLSFMEAITKLAESVGMKIPTSPEQLQKQEKTKPIYDVLSQANQYYQKQLLAHPARQAVITYLKNRELTGKNAKHFQIGFAPNEWDGVLKALSNPSLLLQAGLVIQHDSGKYYDRFRHRIVFPIRDRIGRVVGFGGRVLDDSKPKYLNSPETAVFHKQQILYGLYEYFLSKQKATTAIIVEGYMDVVMLHQFGFYSALATMGTAFGEWHVKTLFGLFSEVCFCFDGDEAGQQAAWKALQVMLPYMEDGRIIKFILLPQGQDPDDFVRKEGQQAFVACIQNAQPLSEFLFAQLRLQHPTTSIDSRANFSKITKTYLEKLPRGVFKDMMFQKLANETRYSAPANLWPQWKEAGNKKWSAYYKNKSPYQGVIEPLPPKSITPGELAWYLLLQYPQELMSVFPSDQDVRHLEQANLQWVPKIIERLRQLKATVEVTEPNRVELNHDASGLSAAQEIYHRFKQRLDLIPKEGVAEEFSGAMSILLESARKQIVEALLKKAHGGELSPEEKQRLKIILSKGGIY
jgi:DNA primase